MEKEQMLGLEQGKGNGSVQRDGQREGQRQRLERVE